MPLYEVTEEGLERRPPAAFAALGLYEPADLQLRFVAPRCRRPRGLEPKGFRSAKRQAGSRRVSSSAGSPRTNSTSEAYERLRSRASPQPWARST